MSADSVRKNARVKIEISDQDYPDAFVRWLAEDRTKDESKMAGGTDILLVSPNHMGRMPMPLSEVLK